MKTALEDKNTANRKSTHRKVRQKQSTGKTSSPSNRRLSQGFVLRNPSHSNAEKVPRSTREEARLQEAGYTTEAQG